MSAFKGFMATILVSAVLAGIGYGVFTVRRQAAARSIDRIEVEPAPPRQLVEEEKEPVDPRLEKLTARSDGARLLWAPEAWERASAAGFADNGTLIVSSDSKPSKETRSRILRVDLADARTTAIFDDKRPRAASGHRAAHRNAGKLCYSSPDSRGVFEIWCSNLDGKEEKQLTKHDGKEDIVLPVISPDGTWVAFEVNDDRVKKPTGGSIWKIGLNGAGIQQLTRGGDDRRPSWSDDGRKIYFQRRLHDGSWDAYVMDSDGKNPTPLLRTYGEDELSPVRRGATDSFILAEGLIGEPTRIKALDAVTKAGRYLTSGAHGPETSPSISPDGQLVSFLAPVSAEFPERLGLWLIPFGR